MVSIIDLAMSISLLYSIYLILGFSTVDWLYGDHGRVDLRRLQHGRSNEQPAILGQTAS